MIYLATDHAGFELKEAVKKHLEELKLPYVDCGAVEYDAQDDYPDFIIKAAEKVAENEDNRGIIFGGSGQGEAIAANKVKGIRAALFYGGDESIITLSREHNNANVLSLAGRSVNAERAKKAIAKWLNVKFTDTGRHQRRLQKISDYESK